MNTLEALRLGNELMYQHGLRQKGWSFELDSAKRRFGVCRHGSKRIGLSRPLTELNDVEKVKDTILHEIAHALVGVGHGHDSVWKAKCVEIGAKPERCYSSEDTQTVAGRYKAVCGSCGEVYMRHKKTPRGKRYACPCQSGKSWDKKVILEFKLN